MVVWHNRVITGLFDTVRNRRIFSPFHPMIDTAEAYGNEEAVGNAIAKSGISRKGLFLVTKVNFRSYDWKSRKSRYGGSCHEMVKAS